MPKRTDIKSILIIGAGPIVIGQACEFDYSGTQACKALKAEGYRIILVNSNPATIMTDPDLADATYIEPITPEIVAKIIAAERPDALLPTMGGQTALNTALALERPGVLEEFGVEMIGARAAAIDMAEDRKLFRDAMDRIGLESPRAVIASSPPIRDDKGRIVRYDTATGFAEAMRALDTVGLPAIIRPAFTLGGTGGGVAYNREEFEMIARSGIDASPVGQILIDESLLGWKEYEMEVVRDKADNCIIVCSIENVDPMGVHTGDSHHRRSGADAHRQRIPDHAQRLDRGAARDRRRDGRLQRAVRRQPGGRAPHRHRDEPARVALLGAGLQGDGLSHRQGRRQARRRLHARRARQRHHRRRHAGLVRADHRLRRHQDSALRLREVPRLRPDADHGHEVGRRGDGHRAHVRRERAEGPALHGDGPVRLRRHRARRSRRRRRQERHPRRRVAADAGPAAEGRAGAAPRLRRRAGLRLVPHRSVVPHADQGDRRRGSARQSAWPAAVGRAAARPEGHGLLRCAAGQAGG